MELQSLIPAMHRSDTPIVAVSPDSPENFKRIIPTVTDRTGSQFVVTLLSDSQLRVINLYGLRNPAGTERGLQVPYPTTYILDKSGRVRWRFTEKNQAVRPTNEMILAELKKLW